MRTIAFIPFIISPFLVGACNSSLGPSTETLNDPYVSSVKPEEKPAAEITTLPLTKGQEAILSSSLSFTTSLVPQLPKNISYVISPLGIQYLIGMLGNAVNLDSQKDWLKILFNNETSWKEVNQTLSVIRTSLPALDLSATISTANLFVYDKAYSGSISYKETLESDYSALVFKADFSDITSVYSYINKWASTHTNEHINSPLSTIDSDIRALFASSIYFSGNWKIPFNPNKTQRDFFTGISNEKVEMPFLNTTSYFDYNETSSAISMKIPYGNGRFIMTLWMPKTDNSIFSIDSIVNQKYSYSLLDLSLPIFQQEYTIDLKELLFALGSKMIDASFVQIGETAAPLSKLEQTVKIAIDEKGTLASSVSAGQASGAPIDDEGEDRTPTVVKINRPFYYVLSDAQTKVVLLMGHMIGK